MNFWDTPQSGGFRVAAVNRDHADDPGGRPGARDDGTISRSGKDR